jgi:hypothetical protein
MDVTLQKLIDKEIPVHEFCSAISLFHFTEEPTAEQMSARWGVPETDIYKIDYKIAKAANPEHSFVLFKSIMYLVEAGIYTNISHIKTKLNAL